MVKFKTISKWRSSEYEDFDGVDSCIQMALNELNRTIPSDNIISIKSTTESSKMQLDWNRYRYTYKATLEVFYRA